MTRTRGLHPAAWWAWSAGLATAAIETTNPFLLGLLGATVCYVVAVAGRDSPTSRSLVFFLRLGLAVIAIRVVLQVAFGDRTAGDVVFSLPSASLPAWAAGVSIGGPVTAQSLLISFSEGLRLAVVLLAFGAANALASPYRLLRCLPAILYEAGVAVTVALTYAPELVLTIGRVREGRRLRGRPTRGIAGLRGLAMPVLERALDRSVELASSMDARGYGRRTDVSSAMRRRSAVTTGIGMLGVMAGIYEVLGAAAPWPVGFVALTAGVGLLGLGLALGPRRAARTRYRPDVWRRAEWAVLASGAAVVLAFSVTGIVGTGLQVSFEPLVVPMVPIVPCVGAIVALLPALLTSRVAPSSDRGGTSTAVDTPVGVST